MKMKFYNSKKWEEVKPEPVKHVMILPPIIIQAVRGIGMEEIEAEQKRLSEVLGRKVIIIRYGYEVIRGI